MERREVFKKRNAKIFFKNAKNKHDRIVAIFFGIMNIPPVFIPIIIGIATEIAKVIIDKVRGTKVAKKSILQTGSFPSAHSAWVASLCTVVFFHAGVDSLEFAIAFVFSIIVLYDSLKIRAQVGLHAKELNKVLKRDKYDERMGHSFIEVFAGTIFGIVGSSLFFIL